MLQYAAAHDYLAVRAVLLERGASTSILSLQAQSVKEVAQGSCKELLLQQEE